MYVLNKKKHGAGCASTFYKIRRMDRGFKTFDTKEDAEIAHLNQSELAEYNLAPYVYSDVCRVRHADGKLSKWGFMTEMAETIKRDYEFDYYDQEEMYSEEIEYLVEECGRVGYSFGDCHLGNVGYVYRNHMKMMVVIDTGDESIVNEDRCYCITCRKGGCCYE